MLVIDLAKEDEPKAPQVFINPEIVAARRRASRSTRKAACRSPTTMPRWSGRPRSRCAYLDRDGKEQEIEADGLLATCLQHEIDHLNGVLFIDHISKLKRDMVVRKFRKLAREKVAAAPRRLSRWRCASSSWERRTSRRATLRAIARGGPRGRRRLYAAAAPGRPARAGADEVARPRSGREPRHRGAHAASR